MCFCCIKLAAFVVVCLSVCCHFAIACGFLGCFKQTNQNLLACFSLGAVSAVPFYNGYFSVWRMVHVTANGNDIPYVCASSWSMPQLHRGKAAWHASRGKGVSNPSAS